MRGFSPKRLWAPAAVLAALAPTAALASEGSMITIIPDSTTLWQAGNFIILVLLLNYLLYKPIRGILQKRAEEMAKLSSDITSSEEGAKDRSTRLDQELVSARNAGAAIRDELKAQGKAKEGELVELATKEMEAAVAKVRDQIASDIGQAREELRNEVRAFGEDLAQKILGRSIQ